MQKKTREIVAAMAECEKCLGLKILCRLLHLPLQGYGISEKHITKLILPLEC